ARRSLPERLSRHFEHELVDEILGARSLRGFSPRPCHRRPQPVVIRYGLFFLPARLEPGDLRTAGACAALARCHHGRRAADFWGESGAVVRGGVGERGKAGLKQSAWRQGGAGDFACESARSAEAWERLLGAGEWGIG